MYNNLTIYQVRKFFCDAWEKSRSHHLLTPLEEIAVDWINQHPEFHRDLENVLAAQEKEYSLENGKTNPFLHLSMHLSIAEQVAIDQPSGIKSIYYTLIQQTGSEHYAAHKIMDCLAEMIWTAQKYQVPFDFQMYSNSIQELVRQV
jgi:hypothetical protein